MFEMGVFFAAGCSCMSPCGRGRCARHLGVRGPISPYTLLGRATWSRFGAVFWHLGGMLEAIEFKRGLYIVPHWIPYLGVLDALAGRAAPSRPRGRVYCGMGTPSPKGKKGLEEMTPETAQRHKPHRVTSGQGT